MVGNMTGGETLIFAGICAGTILAGYTVKRALDYKEKIAVKKLEMEKDEKDAEKQEKIINRLSSTIDKAIEAIHREDFEAPTRKLINRMEPSDVIELPEEEPMTVDVAKKRYPRQPKAKKLYGAFDAYYKITNIDVEKSPPDCLY